MDLDPLYFALRDSTPHGLVFDKAECMKLTRANDVLLKILVQVRCADGGNGALLGQRSDTGQWKSEEWCKGAAIDPRWKAFFSAGLRRNLRNPPVTWNDAFHRYITGRRREGAMTTQKAVTVELRKEGIQHLTDFEDTSNAFACTSANCRAEVLEELINESDRPLFFDRVLNSTVRHRMRGISLLHLSVATSWVRAGAQSSS